MLSREQWQWFADNHQKVRNFCVVGLALGGALYLGLVIKTGWDKGKAPIPFIPTTNFHQQFNCHEKADRYDVNHHKIHLPNISDASGWRFERHYTYVLDAEWFLNVAPECLGARLADLQDNPNPFVIILYDTKRNRPLYRIARIDDVLKR